MWLGIDPLHASPESPLTVAAIEGLRDVLSSSGFLITASPRQSDVRIELTGQRLLRRGIGLIRTTVSRGDELMEVRGRSTESNRTWRSAAVEVVRGLEPLLSRKETPTTGTQLNDIVGSGVPSPSQAVTPELLSRVRDFTASYQKSFASIVAEERYRQEYWQRRLAYPSPLQVTRREQRSEMGFTYFPGAAMWFGFRDVLEVDGKPVPNRNEGLPKLLRDRRIPSSEQFKQVAESSARFNIGPAARNFNVPMTTLLFASPEHRDRCQFELIRAERLGDSDVAVIAFTETMRPTLITRNGHDRPSRGLLWVEMATGRVRRTDLAINEEAIEARLTTWFAHNDHTGLMVPVKMREVYDFAARLDEYVETLATYTNFRRFETTTRIRP